MGWLIGWNSKEEMIKELLADTGESCKVIRHSVVGSHLWVLMHHKASGEKFIYLCLMQYVRGGGPHGRDWGYKSMDESTSPYYYDCPITMLRESTCTDESAVKWREHALKWHQDRISRAKRWKSVKPGDVVANDSRRVVVTEPTYVVSSFFSGRNRFPGQFLGYYEDTSPENVFRFSKTSYTPV